MATVKLRTKASMLRCSAHSLIFKSHLNETHTKNEPSVKVCENHPQ